VLAPRRKLNPQIKLYRFPLSTYIAYVHGRSTMKCHTAETDIATENVFNARLTRDVCKSSTVLSNVYIPELDKIQTINELLCVKYGLISLPFFDVSQVDFIQSLRTR